MYYADGSVYDGQWKAGRRHGHGKMTWLKEGVSYTFDGEFRDDLKDGHGIYTWPDPDDPTKHYRYTGNFLKGKRNGYGQCFYPNGSRYVGDYKDN